MERLLHTPVFLLGDRLLLPKETSLNKHTLLVGIDKGRWSKTEQLPPTSLAGPCCLSHWGQRAPVPQPEKYSTLKFSRLNLEKEGCVSAPQPLRRPSLALCSPPGGRGGGAWCLSLLVHDPVSPQEIVPSEKCPGPCWDLYLGATVTE